MAIVINYAYFQVICHSLSIEGETQTGKVHTK